MMDGCVFVCGENGVADDDTQNMAFSTKSVVLVNLAPFWPVRTDFEVNSVDPRHDKTTLFRNISTSYVFLFIFSEETTMNAFYLNQLGIAHAHGVPIVGIREPSYLMPNPLPEYYYSTEVVSDSCNEGRVRSSTRQNKIILAHLLVECFRNAVVYSTDFHKHCLERLFRKVTDAHAKMTKRERHLSTVTDFTAAKKGENCTTRPKIWTANACSSPICSKCGTLIKTNGRKTSHLHRTGSTENLVKEKRVTPRAIHYDSPQLLITRSVLRPLVGQSTSRAAFQPTTRRPATSVIRKPSSAKNSPSIPVIVRHETSDTRPLSTTCVPTNRVKEPPEEKPAVKSLPEAVVHGVSKSEPARKPSVGFIRNNRGALLRKMSSLPCIPTTYLVTDPGGDKPALVKYPLNNDGLSDNVPEFTDDEDKETIHISRQPSPSVSTCSTGIDFE